MKKCPMCAEEIQDEAKVCRYCHYNIDDGVTQGTQKLYSKNTAGALAILLGGLGVHKFYLDRPVEGMLYILFIWTFIPLILGIIEGISYLATENDKVFTEKMRKKS